VLGLQPHDLLSLVRPVLGLLVFTELWSGRTSWMVLPAVVLACVSDYTDGPMARRAGIEPSLRGRLIDNISDLVFLALVFAAFALREVWSDPVWRSAVRSTRSSFPSRPISSVPSPTPARVARPCGRRGGTPPG
jgi:phosphatidylglycerophosphate synthase